MYKRQSQVEALTRIEKTVLGTSHRQAPVKNLVKACREGLSTLFGLPDGYEVLLGNGGTTAFWDAAAFGLVRERAQHLAFGEFSSKFAKVTDGAPFLGDSVVGALDAGDRGHRARRGLVVRPAVDVDARRRGLRRDGAGLALDDDGVAQERRAVCLLYTSPSPRD